MRTPKIKTQRKLAVLISFFGLAVFLFVSSEQSALQQIITPQQAIQIALAGKPDNPDDEIGPNDFRISDMGIDGNSNFDADYPSVAFNSTNNEYIVVWDGDDNINGLINDENEIFGQRLDAATGAEIGENDFRISDMGPDGDLNFYANEPNVAYNGTNNEYLVVWDGLDTDGDGIFGQRLNAMNGTEVGTNDFWVSNFDAGGGAPAIAYDVTDNQYLVVWGGSYNSEDEIIGQRLAGATGEKIGANDFRISDMGPDGDFNFGAHYPDVVYGLNTNEYLVIWRGDDNINGLVVNELEIFGQRIGATTGTELGNNDFRISDMGPDGDINYWVYFWSSTIYNVNENEYLVVWAGDDNTPPLGDGESEIFGQRIAAIGGFEIGENDFRISNMGPDGDLNYLTEYPTITYNFIDNEYLVAWSGNGVGSGEDEIFGQRLDGVTGEEIGDNDFRLSDMGPDGDTYYDARHPASTYNLINNEYLVVWRGDDDTPPLVNEEREIFGQRYNNSPPTPTPTITSTPTSTYTPTPTPTNTATPTATNTPTITLTPTPPGPVFLPLVIRPLPCFSGPLESEPNSSTTQANGPLCASGTFSGFPNDAWDLFFFDTAPGQILIDLSNHTGSGVQLQLRDANNNLLVLDTTAPYHLDFTGLAGKYYVAIFTAEGFNSNAYYQLSVTFP